MYKPIISFFLVSFSVFSFAQKYNGLKISESFENDTIPKVVYSKIENYSTIVLLNDKYTSLETLNSMNPESIKSVRVEKGKFNINKKKYIGKIIVETKPEMKPIFLTINELVKRYSNLKKDENYVFSIDGEVINANKDDTLLDEKNILQIKILELNKIETPNNLTLIKILTKNKKRTNSENGIIIRGNELSLN